MGHYLKLYSTNGKFTLAYHPWNEPAQRITRAAEGVIVTTPGIGEPVVINKHYPNEVWWDL
jgi:hypothetical protein